ncbi:2-hydroxyacid dehydrogenase [Amycolatopsis pithecellobii]|uniref:D-glycerate dehydrogenase n=1 Tax=Amycolatopsis pithecellobii TaxID=664692 RepID=A0A6N7YLH9_9PSEU|nr:D-glycerate dehydrogenase [Amycolatopsis pithecellobii]MTD52758.1 D-glycerate dehydrogenase [Amycolatopsis pithecellobii]
MRIVVTRRIPEAALVELRALGEVRVSTQDRPLEPDELRKAVAGAHAIVSMLHDRIDESVAEAAGPQLRIVANVAVGHDNIDVRTLTSRGIVVTNTPGVLTDATADLAFGLLLTLTRRIAEGDRLLRAGQPWSFHLGFMLGSGLQAKTLGIIGPGQIGRAMAKRAEAFGLHVVYSGRSEPKETLLRQADVVSLHCPLTPQTHHLIDAAALRIMKPTAVLINTTRGPVVDESALADALLTKQIAGAGLDVFEHEPDVEPRLLELDNVVLTPHLGSATVETRTQMALLAADNVTAVLTGKAPENPVRT